MNRSERPLEKGEKGIAWTLLAATGRTVWCVILLGAAFFGLGSLVGHPGPFVLWAFTIAGSPLGMLVRGRWTFPFCALCGAIVTTLPVALLASYGVEEGGVTGPGQIAAACAVLSAFGFGFALIGRGIGWIVWMDADS